MKESCTWEGQEVMWWQERARLPHILSLYFNSLFFTWKKEKHLNLPTTGFNLVVSLQQREPFCHLLLDLVLHRRHAVLRRQQNFVSGAAEVAQHVVTLIVQEDVFNLGVNKINSFQRAENPLDRRSQSEHTQVCSRRWKTKRFPWVTCFRHKEATFIPAW